MSREVSRNHVNSDWVLTVGYGPYGQGLYAEVRDLPSFKEHGYVTDPYCTLDGDGCRFKAGAGVTKLETRDLNRLCQYARKYRPSSRNDVDVDPHDVICLAFAFKFNKLEVAMSIAELRQTLN